MDGIISPFSKMAFELLVVVLLFWHLKSGSGTLWQRKPQETPGEV